MEVLMEAGAENPILAYSLFEGSSCALNWAKFAGMVRDNVLLSVRASMVKRQAEAARAGVRAIALAALTATSAHESP
jgi:hypothetical protein